MEALKKAPIHQFFFYLLLLFLPTQLGKHFWPQWTLILGRRVDYLSPTIYFTDILLLLLILIWIFSYKFSVKSCKTWVKEHVVQCLLIVVLSVLTTLSAEEKFLAIVGWITYIKLGLFVVYIQKTKPSLPKITITLSLLGVTSTIMGGVQIIMQRSLGGIFWFLGERSFSISTPNIAKSILCIPFTHECFEFLRPYATFSHSNVLGGFLGFVLLLIVLVLRGNHDKKNNKTHQLLLISFFICLGGLVSTLSRSSWFATALGFALLFLSTKKHIVWFVLLGFMVLSLFTVYTPVSTVFDSESFTVRGQLNTASMQIIKQHPLLGVGTHNFLPTLPSSLPFRTIYFLQPVHNIFLLLLAEWGFVGIGLFILFIVIILRRNQNNNLYLPYSFPLLTLCCIGLLDHYLLTIQQGQLLLALAIGISFLERPSSKQNE